MPKRIGQNTVEGVAGQPHPNDPVEDLEIEDTFSSSGRLLEDSEVPGDGCRDPGAQRVAGVCGHPVSSTSWIGSSKRRSCMSVKRSTSGAGNGVF